MEFEELQDSVAEGKPRLAVQLVQEALDRGIGAEVILNQGLLPAMQRIGDRFTATDADVARTLACARAMKRALQVLEPEVKKSMPKPKGVAIIGTAGGDLHDVGKNIVAIMFEGVGFEVIDLGVDVPSERFLQAVRERPEVDIVCISCLLTTSMSETEKVVSALRRRRKKYHYHIMVGGAPISKEFADKIGADIYTENGVEAAQRAAEFLH